MSKKTWIITGGVVVALIAATAIGRQLTGKTTTASKFPNHLILAFEKGYAAIPGAMAQPINSWGEFKKVLRQLKEDSVREKFETIITVC